MKQEEFIEKMAASLFVAGMMFAQQVYRGEIPKDEVTSERIKQECNKELEFISRCLP